MNKGRHFSHLNPVFPFSAMVNAVSPTYADEMKIVEDPQTYFEGGKGLDEVARRLSRSGKLTGILNGFEYKFAPTVERFEYVLRQKYAVKAALAASFANPDGLLLGFVGRAVEQKFKLLTESLDCACRKFRTT